MSRVGKNAQTDLHFPSDCCLQRSVIPLILGYKKSFVMRVVKPRCYSRWMIALTSHKDAKLAADLLRMSGWHQFVQTMRHPTFDRDERNELQTSCLKF